MSAFLGVEPTVALDYQCGIGTSLLRIKYLFPKAHVIGVEKDLEKQKIAKLVGEVHTDLTDLKKEFFDTIFIGNFLEEAESPLVFLYEIQQYLKPNGYIIGEFQNMSSIEHIKMLFDDSWYYSRFQMQNHFTKKDIERMFADTGYINAFFYAYPKEVTEDEKKIMEGNFLGSECQMTYYALKKKKKDL